jgi:HEAT repeat protein
MSDTVADEDRFDDAETFEEDEPNPFERDSDEDLEALFGEDNGRKKKLQTKTAAKSAPKPAQANRTSKTEKPSRTQASASQQNALLNALRKNGLLILDREGRYTFRHPLFAAYLVSLYFKELAPDQQMEKAVLPSWREALTFAAQHTPLDSIVRSRLTSTSDVLNNQVLEMAHWLAHSGQKTAWRGDLLKQLGNLFVAPNQYLPLRERIAAALVGTRDKSAATIFKRSLNHPDDDVRRLACLGLGALRDESSIQDLAGLLADKSTEVQLAAGLALGAVGTQAALEEMVEGLTEGNEQLRQAIAESFAAIPDEGYPVLYDAINHEEMMLRRAAVFGLRRVNTSWAVLVLYRTAMEDEQWYVRSAAEQAFYDMQYGSTASGVRAYPAVESIPWLREWIALQGEEIVKEVEKPEDLLLMAMTDGDPQLQSLSVANIGQLGIAAHVSELYMALRHQDQAVRDAAYQALGELQLQIGQPLPSPN